MPSPFPGIDPWLEDPAIFPDLHNALITKIGDEVNRVLPEPYYATSGSRVWVDVSLRFVEPDVGVLLSQTKPRRGNGKPSESNPALATMPLRLHSPRVIEHDETSEWFLEIFTRRGRNQLVTTLEILSHSNKTPGKKGRELFLKKQSKMLKKRVNLIEIDLLRAGEHTTAAPREIIEREFGAFDYHVSVRPIDEPDDFLVYPWKLASPIPGIAIPLLPGDQAVTIDLQALLTECYDVRNYRRRIDYRSQKPTPPLTKPQTAWAEKLLKVARM